MHESAALWCQIMGCQLWGSDCTLPTGMQAWARTLGRDIGPPHVGAPACGSTTKTHALRPSNEMTQKPKNCGIQMPFGAHLPHSTTSVLPSAPPLCPVSHHLLLQLALLAPEETRPTPQNSCPPYPAALANDVPLNILKIKIAILISSPRAG